MYGLLQPLTVTRNETTKEDGGINVLYEIIAGERRLRASKIAGLSQVPVIIRSGEDTDQMKLELAIIENLQREDLNPVDRAKAFLRLHKDFKFTHIEIGKKMGKSREYVSNTLRLLLLPEAILGYLAEGRMSEGHTRPLLMLNDKPDEQAVLAKEILLKKLTVRESEALARRSAQDKVSAKHRIDPEILSLERKLTEKLGTRVQIEQKEVGGKLVISFFSAEDLSELLNNMRLQNEERGSISKAFNGNPSAPMENLAKKVEEQRIEAKDQESGIPNKDGMIPETENEPLEAEIKVTETSFKKEETGETIEEEALDILDEVIQEVESKPLDETAPELVPDAILDEVVQEAESDSPFAHPLLEKEESASAVMPSNERPLPETSNKYTESSFVPREPEFQKSQNETSDDDADLYSIRNFSI
jgi:ParB family chromosome partitioning protein